MFGNRFGYLVFIFLIKIILFFLSVFIFFCIFGLLYIVGLIWVVKIIGDFVDNKFVVSRLFVILFVVLLRVLVEIGVISIKLDLNDNDWWFIL